MSGFIIGALLFAGLSLGWLVGHFALMFLRDDYKYDLFWDDDE
jgi:hypothetical protein